MQKYTILEVIKYLDRLSCFVTNIKIQKELRELIDEIIQKEIKYYKKEGI